MSRATSMSTTQPRRGQKKSFTLQDWIDEPANQWLPGARYEAGVIRFSELSPSSSMTTLREFVSQERLGVTGKTKAVLYTKISSVMGDYMSRRGVGEDFAINVLRNGGTSYRVFVSPDGLRVRAEFGECFPEDQVGEELMPWTDVKRVLVGRSSECEMTHWSGAMKTPDEAVSALVDLGRNKYMLFEGTDVITFEHHCRIVRYVGNVGNSAVVYGYAVDSEGNVIDARGTLADDEETGYWQMTDESIAECLNPAKVARPDPLDSEKADGLRPLRNRIHVAHSL